MANPPLVFRALNENIVRGWFEADGRTLRPHPQAIVTTLKNGDQANNIMHLGAKSVWDGH